MPAIKKTAAVRKPRTLDKNKPKSKRKLAPKGAKLIDLGVGDERVDIVERYLAGYTADQRKNMHPYFGDGDSKIPESVGYHPADDGNGKQLHHKGDLLWWIEMEKFVAHQRRAGQESRDAVDASLRGSGPKDSVVRDDTGATHGLIPVEE